MFPSKKAIKKYIVGLIIKNSSDEVTLNREKTYVNKMNLILIQVSNDKHDKTKYLKIRN